MNPPGAMQAVLDLDDEAVRRIMAEPDYRRDLRARFERFHASNQFVYEALVALARRGKLHGQTRLGIKQLFEVLRWDVMTGRDKREDWRLDNGYSAFYARLIMSQEPDLKDIFETRKGTWND